MIDKLEDAVICIVGLSYVDLPLRKPSPKVAPMFNR